MSCSNTYCAFVVQGGLHKRLHYAHCIVGGHDISCLPDYFPFPFVPPLGSLCWSSQCTKSCLQTNMVIWYLSKNSSRGRCSSVTMFYLLPQYLISLPQYFTASHLKSKRHLWCKSKDVFFSCYVFKSPILLAYTNSHFIVTLAPWLVKLLNYISYSVLHFYFQKSNLWLFTLGIKGMFCWNMFCKLKCFWQ